MALAWPCLEQCGCYRYSWQRRRYSWQRCVHRPIYEFRAVCVLEHIMLHIEVYSGQRTEKYCSTRTVHTNNNLRRPADTDHVGHCQVSGRHFCVLCSPQRTAYIAVGYMNNVSRGLPEIMNNDPRGLETSALSRRLANTCSLAPRLRTPDSRCSTRVNGRPEGTMSRSTMHFTREREREPREV